MLRKLRGGCALPNCAWLDPRLHYVCRLAKEADLATRSVKEFGTVRRAPGLGQRPSVAFSARTEPFAKAEGEARIML